jgi:hypothetical protein
MGTEQNGLSYRLIPTVQTPSVDPGEVIEISLFVVGHGEVEKADLHVSFDHPHLLDPAEPGRFILSVRPFQDESGLSAPAPGLIQVFAINDPSYTTIGVRPLFWDMNALREILSIMESVEPSGNIVDTPEDQFSPIVFSRPYALLDLDDEDQSDHRNQIEDTDGVKPPVKIELKTLPPRAISGYLLNNVEEWCQPGDYRITFTLTYGDETQVYQDQSEIIVHVNSWTERNSTTLRVLAILLAAVAAMAALPTILENISELFLDILNNLDLTFFSR